MQSIPKNAVELSSSGFLLQGSDGGASHGRGSDAPSVFQCDTSSWDAQAPLVIMAHLKQSRPDSGLGSPVKGLYTF